MSLANFHAPSGDGQHNGRRRGFATLEHLTAVTASPDEVDAPEVAELDYEPNIVETLQEMEAEDLLLGAQPAEPSELEVRLLEQLRPVPPAISRAVPTPVPQVAGLVDALPVYDPFTARRRRAPEWLVQHTAALVAVDVLAAGLALLLAAGLPVTGSAPGRLLQAGALAGWPILLALWGTYAERRQGTGIDEYRRVFDAGLVSLAALGVAAVLRPGDGFGRLMLVGVPVATVLTLIGRVIGRWRLHAARRRGLMMKRVVVVGPDESVRDLVGRVQRDSGAGLRVVGVCVPNPQETVRLREQGLPVLGALDEVTRVLDDVRADAVLVAAASQTSGGYLRDLAWRLEGTNVELLVGAGMIEVAPNRLHVRPTVSVPLIRIQEPEFRGSRRLVKAAVDRCAALVLLVATAPVFLAIACAIRFTSHGPVLYRHRRIGKCGREFDLFKFRSMVVDADQRVEALMVFNEGNEVQFKLRRDPRVTRVGQFLRKYSLDELPQLINVLRGDMSLVGPRPHVTREVQLYGADAHRRLLVKPGITGLWQVSGRSDLSWDQAVELDVRYVENWSLGLDLSILWRTLRAVLRSAGAY